MKTIYLHITNEDTNYLSIFKSSFMGRANFVINNSSPSSYFEIILRAKKAGCVQVATSSPLLLKHLLGKDGAKLPSLDDYQGSIIEKAGIEFLILPPFKQLVTVTYGRFLFARYLSKFLHEEKFLRLPEFRWTLYEPRLFSQIIDRFTTATYIAVDIETVRDDDDRSIDCVGFTAIYHSASSYSLYTIVVPLDSSEYLGITEAILSLRIPKIFQNGKYDIAYLLRYSFTISSYAFDTLNLFHSWYSELPKDLGFITSFMIRKWQYWKDEGKTGDRMQHFEYNAKDCYTTAIDFLALMYEMPQWALNNYKLEFPLTFPCVMAELRGIAVDEEFFQLEEKRFDIILDNRLSSIRTMVDNASFNPSSWQQVLKLFEILGSSDITDTTPPSMDKVSYRHPLNMRILAEVTSYRKDRKLSTSYLRSENEKTGEKDYWHGRNFFSLSPAATDTGRLASKESAYWCGKQIQNIPRDREDIQIRYGFVADRGFFFGECDRSQAEARDTAYLSGDKALIAAVDDITRDFHGINASSFFGIPYSDIVLSKQDTETETWIHKTVNKVIRDLAKRTNHGANYNMMAQMLLNTMGIKNVIRARQLLQLPSGWSLLQVTGYLLEQFDKTYPVVRSKQPGGYYHKIIADVEASRKLVGPTGWTRYCFGNPGKNKMDLNALAAHPSQSLNAMELNIAYLRVFKEIALNEPVDFRLGPQIHDSILFQYRIGRSDLPRRVAACMDNPIYVTDIFGIKRLLKIPTDLKGEATRWSELVPIH